MIVTKEPFLEKENIIKTKSYGFAIRIVNLYKILVEEKKEYILAKQLLRAGTSIGALVRESEHAESKADFIHKLSVALKEANESEYWLDILYDTNFISSQIHKSITKDNKELLKLLTAIIKTSKQQ